MLRPYCRSDTCVYFLLQEGKRPEDVKQALREKNINVSISPANSTLLDFSQRGLTQVLRASVHYYNTEEEVHRFIEALKTL
jgi:cysteine desulfurase/selenocysteine lyase